MSHQNRPSIFARAAASKRKIIDYDDLTTSKKSKTDITMVSADESFGKILNRVLQDSFFSSLPMTSSPVMQSRKSLFVLSVSPGPGLNIKKYQIKNIYTCI